MKELKHTVELEYLYRAIQALGEIFLTAEVTGLDGQWAMEMATELRQDVFNILQGGKPSHPLPERRSSGAPAV